MVNQFAEAVKSIHTDNLVIAGGTAPFGHDVNMAPLRFMRDLLCLSPSLEPTCKETIHLDIWAHHPYTSGGPTHHANSPSDVSLDRKSTRLNSSHGSISYAVFCLKK